MSAKILLAGVAVCAASGLTAQTPAVSGTFVSTIGVDTVAIERYTRGGNKLEGDIITRYPRVRILHYVADLRQASFTGISMAIRRVGQDPATPPPFSMVTLMGDSTGTVEVQRSGRPDTASTGNRAYRGRVAPAVPVEPASFGVYEQILAFNPPTTADSVVVTTIGVQPGVSPTISMVRKGRDSVIFNSSFAPGWIERASVDQSGRITGVDATATTVKAITRRVNVLDFDAVSKSWAAIEAAKGAAGQMSPPDTVRATVARANIRIDYSRPFRRGRSIFGNVVPWNQVWRTGANAATQLSTSADLIIRSTTLPAGKYSLFMLPTATGAKLIINRQTGQWGTEYDPSKDFARIDLNQTTLAQPADQFTIAVAPLGTGGILRMRWDDKEYSLPFRVK